MISLVTGTVRSLTPDRVVVDVGGVGLSIAITSVTASQLNLGIVVTLQTSLVVREDSLTLFGFLDEGSRTIFELLQTVSGIGPKVALAILGAHTPTSLANAIAQENLSALEKVPGIGKKGAQRLILELKGKLSDFAISTPSSHQPQWREQLSAALISLGFSAKDADTAITSVVQEIAESGNEPSDTDLSHLLKLALQQGRRA